FAARAGLVLALRDVRQGPCSCGSSDDHEFHVSASSLARGEGYLKANGQPTSFRAPGFPIILAGVYALAGERPPVVYLVLCALGALSCVLTYLVAREVADEAAARWSAALAVVFLPHAWFATLYLSENLFVPLLALGTWLFLRYLRGGPA